MNNHQRTRRVTGLIDSTRCAQDYLAVLANLKLPNRPCDLSLLTTATRMLCWVMAAMHKDNPSYYIPNLVIDAAGKRWRRWSLAEWENLLGVTGKMVKSCRSLLVQHHLIVVRPWGYDEGDPRGMEYTLGPRPDREIG